MRSMHFTRKTTLVILLIALLAGGSAFVYTQTQDTDKQSEKQAQQDGEINLEPPTEEEERAGDEQKEEIVEQQEHASQPPDKANLVIADAGQYDNQIEIRAFVTNIIEAGTCTFTFTKDGASIIKRTDAFEDASTTQCGALDVPRSEFATAGTWTVSVRYESPNASGKAEHKLEVK